MHWTLVQTAPPASEPLTLDEAKAHLRVDTDDDDALISSLIAAARETAESWQRRAYITRTYRLTLDCWPWGDTIRLPRPPLRSVESITYTDVDGVTRTLDPSVYEVDTASEPGRIRLAFGQTWPTVTLKSTGAIQIVYTAGYGDDAAAVPQVVKHAMLLLIGHWYENREAVVVGQTQTELPMAVEALLQQHRIWPFDPAGGDEPCGRASSVIA